MNFKQLKPKIINLAAQDDDIEILWLYGSQAKGTAHQNSDIDLAIAFKTYQSDVLERRLRPEMLAVKWQRQLELGENQLSIVDINIAPIPLCVSVLEQGYVLSNKNVARQLQEQQRIMSMWEIDYMYHYKHFNMTGTK